MVEIKQQLIPMDKRKATYGIGNPVKKMVVHQTGNTSKGANAQVHADLQSRGFGASWHIQSDDKEVIQSWPFTYRLWHASTGQSSNGGNMVGIGWEICINSDGNYLKSLEVAAKGIAKVMKQEGIPMNQLTTHNAEDPKNKYCPAQILAGKDGVNWTAFKAMVQKAYDGKPVSQPSKPATPSQPVAPSQPSKPSLKSMDVIVKEVSAGLWGNNPQRAEKLKAAGYNPQAIQDVINGKQNAPSKPALKSMAAIVSEVNAGKWGNNPQRAEKLKAAGYNPQAIQDVINGKQSAPSKPALKSLSVIANEVKAGLWGNDPDRKRRLEAAGYNYNNVQAEVNRSAKTNSPVASKPSQRSINKGSRATVKSSASRYATGESIPGSIKGKSYTAMQVGTRSGKKQVLLKEIMSWVWESDLS